MSQINTMVSKLLSSLDASGDGNNVKLVMYKSSAVIDGKMSPNQSAYVLLGKRLDIKNGPVGNVAYVGEIEESQIPPKVKYIGTSTFDEAKKELIGG